MKLQTYRPLFAPPDAPAPGGAPPSALAAPAAPEVPSTGGGAEPPASTSTSDKAGAGDDFKGLGGDFDDEVTLPPAATPAPAPVAADGKTPSPEPQVPKTPAVDPKASPAVVPPAAPTAPAPVAQPASASSSPAEPQGLVQQLEQHRDAVIAGLASERFKLTKEEAEALDLNPTEAIPKLMARTYYNATQAALLHIQNFVPQMIVETVRALKQHEDVETEFYGKHPYIDKGKHAEDVKTFASAFRSSNPQMAPGDIRALVAAAVAAKHGLQVTAPAQQNGAAPVTPRQQVPAFVPAKTGASVRVSPDSEHPFAGLGQNFDDD